MQQPSSQPGGSYGNTPYAAPPPKRGFSFLTCCLGCLGIAVVIAVVLGIIVANQLKKAAGPPITEANYRQELPADFPLYPGMKLDEKTTASMHAVGGVVGLVPKAGLKMRLMAFDSPKDLNALGPWYKTQLAKRGWRVTSTTTGDRQSSWQFQKDDTQLFFSDSGDSRGKIIIGVGKGKGFAEPRRRRMNR